MRVNRITATAVTCSLAASLGLGAAGAAGASAPADRGDATHRGPGHRALPVAQADAASASARVARHNRVLKGVIKPVDQLTRLLTEVGGLQSRKLTPQRAEHHSTAMARAVAPLTATRPGSAGTPPQTMAAQAARDLRDRVDALLRAAVRGDVAGRDAAAGRAVTGGSNLMAAALMSGKLPAPDLKGLPKLPSATGR